MAYFGYSQTEFISGILILILATISLVSTLVTLWLIHDMNKWNGYMLLIFNLTLCQAVYDISFYFLLAFRNYTCFGIHKFLSILAGLSVTLWTNVISVVLYYIITNLRSLNIYYYFRSFLFTIVAISTTYAMLEIVSYFTDNDGVLYYTEGTYYLVRLISIFFNIIVHLILSVRLYRMGLIDPTATDVENIRKMNDPLKKLSSRLKYYPIIQVITWIGAAWYEYDYGFTTSSFDHKNTFSLEQRTSIYVYDICSPSAGLGFFIVFLLVQPTAYKHLKKRIRNMLGIDRHYHEEYGRYAHSEWYASIRQKSNDNTGSSLGHGSGSGSGGGNRARSTSKGKIRMPSTSGTNANLVNNLHHHQPHSQQHNPTHSIASQGSSNPNTHHHYADLLLADNSEDYEHEYDSNAIQHHNNIYDNNYYDEDDDEANNLDEDELARQMEYKYSIVSASGNYTDTFLHTHHDIQ